MKHGASGSPDERACQKSKTLVSRLTSYGQSKMADSFVRYSKTYHSRKFGPTVFHLMPPLAWVLSSATPLLLLTSLFTPRSRSNVTCVLSDPAVPGFRFARCGRSPFVPSLNVTKISHNEPGVWCIIIFGSSSLHVSLECSLMQSDPLTGLLCG